MFCQPILSDRSQNCSSAHAKSHSVLQPINGGVDLFDKFFNNYCTKIRSKKWWWPFFSWCLDASIVNAWLLQKKVMESTMPLLDFRRSVAQQLLKQHETGSRFGEEKLSHSQPQAARAIRYDCQSHWPVPLPTRFSRCRQCGRRCSVKCIKCDAPLHVECFQIYHQE